MKKRRLGNTDLYLSELGFGCASLWGKPQFTSDEQAEKLFFTAYGLGINFFDTGHSYGVAEERLGACIRKLGAEQRKNLVLSTKCGTRVSRGRYYHDWSTDWMKRSVETSLRRLGVDVIDMLHLHGPDRKELTDHVLDWMYGLKADGVVRAVGINTFDTETLRYVCENRLFDFVMTDYSILRQDREELIRRLYGNRTGVVAGAPLAQSLCTDRVYRLHGRNDLWYLLRALKNFRGQMKAGRRFRFLDGADGMRASQAALRYVLDNPFVTSAVFGTVNAGHLAENTKAAGMRMSPGLRRKIRAAGRKKTPGMDRK